MGREFEFINLVKIYPEAPAFVRGIYIGGIVACVFDFERQVLQNKRFGCWNNYETCTARDVSTGIAVCRAERRGEPMYGDIYCARQLDPDPLPTILSKSQIFPP